MTEEPLHPYLLSERTMHLLRQGLLPETVQKISEEKPSLYEPQEIDERIQNLRALGFRGVTTLINKAPTILTLTPETVRTKMKDLNRFFADPVSFVTQCPAALTYSIKENVEPKMMMVDALVKKYKIPMTAEKLVTRNNSILTSSLERLQVLVKVFRRHIKDPKEIRDLPRAVSDLLFSNLEDVVLAVVESRDEEMTLEEFIDRVKEVRSMGYSEEDKQKLIESDWKLDPESPEAKIRGKYIEGFSKIK